MCVCLCVLTQTRTCVIKTNKHRIEIASKSLNTGNCYGDVHFIACSWFTNRKHFFKNSDAKNNSVFLENLNECFLGSTCKLIYIINMLKYFTTRYCVTRREQVITATIILSFKNHCQYTSRALHNKLIVNENINHNSNDVIM